MNRSLRGWIGVACALALGSAAAQAGEFAPQPFDWSGPIAPGQRLDVSGVNGAIVVVAGEGRELKVHAVKTGRRSDPADVRVEVTTSAKGVQVCTVYPGGGSCDRGFSSLRGRDNDVQVDYRIVVPSGVSLELATVNGNVEVKAVDGAVKAATVNGNCTIATRASGEATTVNGSVDARIGRLSPDDRLEFTSVNGSITVTLPSNVSAGVDATTLNGSMQTDFPLQASHGFGPRSLHGTLGRGGARVKMSSVNGSIRLQRDGPRAL